MELERYFSAFRKGVIGIEEKIDPVGKGDLPLIYADWIASGRLYGPIEDFVREKIGPLVANTHTETTTTGTAMTRAYHQARSIIRRHVHAAPDDSVYLAGFGMTAAVNKLQRILGLRIPEDCRKTACKNRPPKPLVIVTHMEHHSNQITWQECDCDLQIIPRNLDTGLPDLLQLEKILETEGKDRRIIGAFTACSNVTGLMTPYHAMAGMVHHYGGVCFIDFAASAPYVDIDMHPETENEYLDGILFSPHKFLGGPGGSGVMVLSNKLYHNTVPDQPGGGTVLWTTPFGTHRYFDEIEVREDGGTPGFLQAMRAALAIRLKEEMVPEKMLKREEELREILLKELCKETDIFLMEPQDEKRIGIVSFYSLSAHYNLIVRLLNDRFGIQTRGGCSCAGTYGHILFNITKTASQHITEMINQGDLSEKPGWVRISLHPVMTDEEVRIIGKAVVEVIRNYDTWAEDYEFHKELGEFFYKGDSGDTEIDLDAAEFFIHVRKEDGLGGCYGRLEESL